MKVKDQKVTEKSSTKLLELSAKARLGVAKTRVWVKNHRSQLRLGGIGAGILALSLLLVVTIGIYGFGWHNRAAKAVSYVIPYPVASVDGDVIYYSQYIRTFSHFDDTINDDRSPVSESDLSDHTITAVVNQRIISAAAQERGITVSDEEIADHFQSVMVRNPAVTEEGEDGFDHAAMRRQSEASLLAYKLEQDLAASGELSEENSWQDWLLERRGSKTVRYFMPQHSRQRLH